MGNNQQKMLDVVTKNDGFSLQRIPTLVDGNPAFSGEELPQPTCYALEGFQPGNHKMGD